jgi:hypothetical protein
MKDTAFSLTKAVNNSCFFFMLEVGPWLDGKMALVTMSFMSLLDTIVGHRVDDFTDSSRLNDHVESSYRRIPFATISQYHQVSGIHYKFIITHTNHTHPITPKAYTVSFTNIDFIKLNGVTSYVLQTIYLVVPVGFYT